MIKKISTYLIIAIIGGLVALLGYKFFIQPSEASISNDQLNSKLANYEYKTINIPTFDFSEIAEKVTNSVVHIKTIAEVKQEENNGEKPFDPFDFFGDEFGFRNVPRGPRQGSGSGVIVSKEGYIITNNHVIDGATKIDVTLHDNRSFKADVIGTDPNTDLALVKINAKDLEPMAIGNSDEAKVGQWVLAVGNPFNLTSTITAGIISAKGRNINLLGGASIESFIQTDAAVNPGNSGGALVSTTGELIGINTAIASSTGQYAGYSFAVPVNLMKKVMQDFMEFGEVQRGYLGVNIQNVDDKIAQENKLEKPSGVYIANVLDKSAAEKSGLKTGDIITHIDGKEVATVPQLQETIGRMRPGDETEVTIIRKSEVKNVKITLLNKDGKAATTVSSMSTIKKELGAEFEMLDKKELEDMNLTNGIKVKSINGGIFKKSEIPEGFVITKIDKMNMYNPYDVYRTLQDKKGGILVEGYTSNGDRKYFVLDMGKE